MANGHFQYQVLWNWYFDPGTDKLNGAGMEKLDSIARTTPGPDPKLYVQAARDVAVTTENAPKVAVLRDDLTARRAAAIQRYMATQPGTPVAYEIAMVDMPTAGIYAPFATNSFRGKLRGYAGSVKGAVGTGSGSNIQGGGNITQTVTGGGGAAGAGGGGNGDGSSGSGNP